MKTPLIPAVAMMVFMVAFAACGGTDSPTVPPTDPPPLPTQTPAPTPTTPPPTETPEPTQAADGQSTVGSEGDMVFDPEEVAARALSSPALMTCLSEAVGFATLLELAGREPTEEEVRLMTPCVEAEFAPTATP